MLSKKLKNKINFTKSGNFTRFDSNVEKELLKYKKNDVIEIFDYIFPIVDLPKQPLYKIKDHINLTGKNPLKGPLFIPLSNIYNIKDGIVIAGLNNGNIPNSAEIKVLLNCNVSAYSYNIVPTVILSTYLGLKVYAFGIV